MCGRNSDGTISNCYAGVQVYGYRSLGGLCGFNIGTIINCYSYGTINGDYDSENLGGLCGWNPGGTISNCYSSATVTGNDSENLGGLCGSNSYIIKSCYSSGSVTSGGNSENLGGLCGFNQYNTISNCYATGPVVGRNHVGGLCGYNRYGKIINCYSSGKVSGSNYVGGLCGRMLYGLDAIITSCFWDVNSSGIGNAGDDNYGATGKTTGQMRILATFTSAGWDFTDEMVNGTADIWRLCIDGIAYPHLSWEYGPDYTCPDGVSFKDLLYLSNRWLESEIEPFTSADRTGDGAVNMKDYALLAQVRMIKEKYGNGKYKKSVILDFLEKDEGIKMSNGTLNKILKGTY